MADKSSQLVLSALTRAAADAGGLPLHGSKSSPGLFPTTAAGKQAAQRCCDEGYLRAVEHAGNGRAAPACAITDKGLAYLLGQVSPRQVLEDFVRVLEAREDQVRHLLDSARHTQASVEALRGHVAAVLSRLCSPAGDLKAAFQEFHQGGPPANGAPPAPPSPALALLAALSAWGGSVAGEDCPLPELYRSVQGSCPGLTLGGFHDALRGLVKGDQLYLHPWTGPLYEIPEPPFALLIGHEVAYYASLREGGR